MVGTCCWLINTCDKKKCSGCYKENDKEPSVLNILHLNYHISGYRCMFRREIRLKLNI